VTTTVTWSSSATAVATISNTAGTKGLATAVSTGTTTITATSGAITGSTGMTVTQGGGGGAAVTFVQASGSTDDTSAGTITQAFTSKKRELTNAQCSGATTWLNIRAWPTGRGIRTSSPPTISTRARGAGAGDLLRAERQGRTEHGQCVTFGVNGAIAASSPEYGVATTSPLTTAKNTGNATTR
jgi:hypothetical protein